jgi:hypothetical protein
MVQEEVCFLSGLLPTPACPYRRWEWFIEDTQPTQPDHFYHQVQIDTASGRLADADTPPDRRYNTTVLDLPPEAQTWAHAEGLKLMSDLLAASGVETSPNFSTPLRLTSPTNGSVYRLSPGMDADAQRITVEAVGEAHMDEVSLWMDGILLGSFEEGPYRLWWPLAEGSHEVWAEGLTQNGERVMSERVVFIVEL